MNYSMNLSISGYHRMSTYDYVINRRQTKAIDQTLSQFNQLQVNRQQTRIEPKKVS